MSSITYPENKNNNRCLQTFKASSGSREHADTDLGTTVVAIPIAQFSYKIRKEVTGQIETFSQKAENRSGTSQVVATNWLPYITSLNYTHSKLYESNVRNTRQHLPTENIYYLWEDCKKISGTYSIFTSRSESLDFLLKRNTRLGRRNVWRIFKRNYRNWQSDRRRTWRTLWKDRWPTASRSYNCVAPHFSDSISKLILISGSMNTDQLWFIKSFVNSNQKLSV